MVVIPDIWKGLAIGMASMGVPLITSWAAGWIPKEKESSLALASFASVGMALLTLAITRPPTTTAATIRYYPARESLVKID